MHQSVAALLLATNLAGTTPAAAQDRKTGELTIHATGFAHGRGHAIAKIFAPNDKVRGPARWQTTAAIQNRGAVLKLQGLQAGTFAVVVFHDENDNGVIDHGVLGRRSRSAFPADLC